MSKGSSRSQLQNNILHALSESSSENLSELARVLEVARPSLSRAMHTLAANGLVKKEGKLWILTPAGQDEVDRLDKRLAEQVQVVRQSVDRQRAIQAKSIGSYAVSKFGIPYDLISSMSKLTAGINPISTSIVFDKLSIGSSSIDAALAALVARDDSFSSMGAALAARDENFSSMGATLAALATQNTGLPSAAELAAGPLFETIKSWASPIANESLFDSLNVITSRLGQEALESVTRSAGSNLLFIEQVSGLKSVGSWVIQDLGTTNLYLSKMISDLGAINTGSFIEQGIINTSLMPHVAEVTRTLNNYLASEWTLPAMEGLMPPRLTHFVVPTQTTATFIHTVREIHDTSEEGSESYRNTEENLPLRSARMGQVDIVLSSVGPQFVAMWQGAFATLSSENPDRIRQSAHSGRELLMQILAALAPDSSFSEDELEQYGHNGAPTRKMRVKKILGVESGSKVDWVEAMAKSVDAMYARLASISHDRNPLPQTTDQQVIGVLHVVGGVLLFLLSEE